MKLKQKMFMKILWKQKFIWLFFDLLNKKNIGTMKDEFIGKIASKFVGLKSKMCFLVDGDGKENKKVK